MARTNVRAAATECAIGATVGVSTDDLMDMYNNLRQNMADGMKEMAAKKEAAKNAANEAEEAMKPIRPRDAEIGEQVAPGAVAAAVEAIFKRYREQSAEEELGGVMDAEDNGSGEREGETPKDEQRIRRIVGEALPAPARKYVPFDRSNDRVDTVKETPEGRADYERARGEYAKAIAETAERPAARARGEAFGRVGDEKQAFVARERLQRRVIGGAPVDVHGNDGARHGQFLRLRTASQHGEIDRRTRLAF
jgi:hypothetical protein